MDVRMAILDVFKNPTKPFVLASLATMTEKNTPWVRYVFVSADDQLMLRVATFVSSRKVKHIQRNPEVHLTCGVVNGENWGDYLQIAGRAKLSVDPHEKKAFWNDSMLMYFSGPEDENYGIIIVEPYLIELQRGMETHIWTREE